jgi:arylsulfatase
MKARKPSMNRTENRVCRALLVARSWFFALLVPCIFVVGCERQRPSVLMISLDAVRQDHLSLYGYWRKTTPIIDEIGKSSVVFWNAFAQQTNTNPSHATLFTSLYPHVHGNLENGYHLPESRTALAEVLRDAGFQTAAFVSGWSMIAATGLSQGFDVYDDDGGMAEKLRRDGQATVERALEWLGQRDRRQPYFLFVHLFDAHGPYLPREEYLRMFRSKDRGPTLRNVHKYALIKDDRGRVMVYLNGYVDRYDALIRTLDDLVAQLLEVVDSKRTIIVIFSDHGETLGERYRMLDHGGQVFDEQIRIPLIIRAPGIAPARIEALVETVDILPTVLELLGLHALPEAQGRSLVPLMSGRTREERKVVFSSARTDPERHADRGYDLDKSRQIHTIRSVDWKLIAYPGVSKDYFELYDLRQDPGETRNLAYDNSDVAKAMLAQLNDWLSREAQARPTPKLSDEDRERLRRLGYLGERGE